MDNVELLLLAIEREPDDLTAVAALTDALCEERDMTRSEADRHAERAVQTVRDARDLAEAARLLQPQQPWHAGLMRDLVYHARLPMDSVLTAVVTVGGAPPTLTGACDFVGAAYWQQVTVTVGARWVIDHFRKHPSLFLMEISGKRVSRRAQ